MALAKTNNNVGKMGSNAVEMNEQSEMSDEIHLSYNSSDGDEDSYLETCEGYINI